VWSARSDLSAGDGQQLVIALGLGQQHLDLTGHK